MSLCEELVRLTLPPVPPSVSCIDTIALSLRPCDWPLGVVWLHLGVRVTVDRIFCSGFGPITCTAQSTKCDYTKAVVAASMSQRDTALIEMTAGRQKALSLTMTLMTSN